MQQATSVTGKRKRQIQKQTVYYPYVKHWIDPEYKEADMDYEVTRSDIKILKQIHSLGDEQYKRLMTYMKALQKLEQMESMVEE